MSDNPVQTLRLVTLPECYKASRFLMMSFTERERIFKLLMIRDFSTVLRITNRFEEKGINNVHSGRSKKATSNERSLKNLL